MKIKANKSQKIKQITNYKKIFNNSLKFQINQVFVKIQTKNKNKINLKKPLIIHKKKMSKYLL